MQQLTINVPTAASWNTGASSDPSSGNYAGDNLATVAFKAQQMFADLYAARGTQLLAVLHGASMQSTADQPFTRTYGGTNYQITAIVARQRTGGASVACAGGIYDAASKGGNAIVAAGQSWVTLAASVIVVATLAGLNSTALLANTPILSLTTGSTAACTADLFVYGYDIS